jgi:hypothetical protein
VSHPKGSDQPGGAVHGTEGGNSEPDREPRQAQLGKGNDREGTQSPSVPTSQTRLTGWVQKDTEEGPAAGRSGAAGFRSSGGVHPSILPAKSAALNPTTNGGRERGNPSPALHEAGAGRAQGARGGMSPEAKATGKAGG